MRPSLLSKWNSLFFYTPWDVHYEKVVAGRQYHRKGRVEFIKVAGLLLIIPSFSQ